MVGSPPDSCTRSGSPSLATSTSSMRSISASGRWLPCMSAGIGEADRAGEIARLVDLDDREAAVLLVVGAEPAIERATGLGAGLRA